MDETLKLVKLLIETLPENEQVRLCDQLRGFAIGFVLGTPDGEKLIEIAYKKADGR